jgi:DNA-binding SARP family transcriptional activator
MLTPQNIKETIARKGAEEQLEALAALMPSAATDKERALLLAEKGKILWRMNRRGDAISAYEQGAQLDPDGPASLLLAHSQSIMDFFNPDLLNP